MFDRVWARYHAHEALLVSENKAIAVGRWINGHDWKWLVFRKPRDPVNYLIDLPPQEIAFQGSVAALGNTSLARARTELYGKNQVGAAVAALKEAA